MEEFLLIFGGLLIGSISGFFGIGGGTVTVPYLLYMGFDIKTAIGISVMQMVAGSLMGAWIHRKRQTYNISDIKYFGYGGIIGAIIGALLVSVVDGKILGWIFLCIVFYTLVRLFLSTPVPTKPEIINHKLFTIVGSGVGIFSGMLGVGGSILMTPILVNYFGFALKKASAVGFFFVIFTSISAFITFNMTGHIDISSGILLTIASLAGVHLGIWALHKTKDANYKTAIIIFYIIIFVLTTNKLIDL